MTAADITLERNVLSGNGQHQGVLRIASFPAPARDARDIPVPAGSTGSVPRPDHDQRHHLPFLFPVEEVVVVLHRMDEAPRYRALPARTTSCNASIVSSMGLVGSHR